MDSQHSFDPRRTHAQGGTVEPASAGSQTKDQPPKPTRITGERYEIRDISDVTYRSDSFAEITAKAAQLNCDLVFAVAPDGTRAMLRKKDGEWHRGSQHPAAPERSADRAAFQPGAIPNAANASPIRSGAQALAQAEQGGSTPLAAQEAQAERAALVARVEAALMERYVIKRAPITVGPVSVGHTEYRFRGDTSRVAFTESTFRLATDTNSPSVARSMVDVAEARNWKAVRVAGSEDFRRMVWLEASARGVKALGYEPNPTDLEVLKREREARQVNRIEPDAGASMADGAEPAGKRTTRGGGGRKTLLAAIEAVLVAREVPEKRRGAILAAAAQELPKRFRPGQGPVIRLYDKDAPRQRPVVVPAQEVQRAHERAEPSPAR